MNFLKRRRIQRYFRLYDQLDDAAFATDGMYRVVYWNTMSEMLLGRPAEAAVGRKVQDLYDVEKFPPSQDTIREIVQERGHWRGEAMIRTRAGVAYWTDISVKAEKIPGLKDHGMIFIVKNITEQKVAVDALNESEARFRTIFYHADLAILFGDKDVQPLFINPAFTRMLGYEQSDFSRNRARNWIHRDDRADGERFHQEMLCGERNAYHIEMRLYHRDGHMVWGRVTLSAIRNEAGEVQNVIATIEDISSQKQTEEALRMSESRLELANEGSSAGLWDIDLLPHPAQTNKRNVYLSPRLKKLIGYEDDELESTLEAWQDRIFPEDLSLLINSATEHLDGKREFHEVEYRIRHKDGSLRWLYSRGKIFRDENGVPARWTGIDWDITERKLAEDALRENEERFRLMAELSQDIIYRFRTAPKPACDYISPAVETILNKSPAEFYSDPFLALKLIHPDDRKQIQQKIEKLDLFDAPIVLRWTRTGGPTVWTELQNVAVRDEQGNLTAVVGVARDISERVKAEEALRDNEERFRLLAENAQDVIYRFRLGINPGPDYLSPAVETLTGYKAEEFYRDYTLGLRIIHPDDREQLIVKNVTSPEFNRTIVLRWRRKDGVVIWIEQKNVPIQDARGNLVAVEGVAREVTDRIKATTALQDSENRFRSSFEKAGICMAIGALDGRYLLANEALCEMLGHTEQQLMYMTDWEVTDARDQDVNRAQLQRLLQGEIDSLRMEKRYVHKDGHNVWALYNCSVVRNLEDSPVYIIMQMQDITHLKWTEDELRESQEQLRHLSVHLQSIREEERARIAHAIHDDLGQSLTALKMDLSWLNKKMTDKGDGLSDKVHAMVELTDATIKTVKRISTNLRPGLLDDLGLAAAIEWQAGEFQKRTEMECNLVVEPEEIEMDGELSTALFRIFQESLTNIARHAHARRVDIRLVHRDDMVELTVRDDGHGIEQEQITDPNSFGLMGIRERVRHFRGKLEITGVPQGGTTVSVRIPITKGE